MAASLPLVCSSMNKIDKEERDESTKRLERSYQRYRDIISTLPREKGWGGDATLASFCLYEGFWHPIVSLEGVMGAKEYFQARPDDVLLISSPKSGTTWLKALIFAIMKRNRYTKSTHPLLTHNPHDCVPMLEHQLFKEPSVVDIDHNLPSPRLLGTHIPYASLPESILCSDCKIVYVCRDPKDVLISMWQFFSKLISSKDLPPLSLEKAFEMFSKGTSFCGPYWDHVHGYWKASLECPHRFFFVTYEEMKRDTLVKVKMLAEFLGQSFSVEEKKEQVVEEIIELCSFDKLRNLEVNKSVKHTPDLNNDAFFRKGEIGDWRNHLTNQMVESLDQITNEKLHGIFTEKRRT